MLHQAGQLHDQLIQPVYSKREKKKEECFIFTHRGNFQALKVFDLKLSLDCRWMDKECFAPLSIVFQSYHGHRFYRWR
jgi:hypothetical protein